MIRTVVKPPNYNAGLFPNWYHARCPGVLKAKATNDHKERLSLT